MRYVHGMRGDDDALDEYLDPASTQTSQRTTPTRAILDESNATGPMRPNQTPMKMQERSR